MPQGEPGNVGDVIGDLTGGLIGAIGEAIGDAAQGGGGYVPPAGGGSTSGGSGGGGGSSSSGGSGGGGGQGEAQAKANNKAFFVNTLKELGIPLTGNMNQLINNALAKNYNSANFMFYLRQTKEYHQKFTGIFNKNGTLKMSEAQYLSNLKQYENLASKAGINIGPKMMDWLFLNNVSPSEFADRATSYTRLRRNEDLYRAFKQELIQSGEKPNALTRKNMLKFILGEGNQKWYDTWQDAVTRNAAQQAGVAIGKRNALANLGQGAIERISGLGLSEAALSKGFTQIADDIANLLPDSQLFQVGLTKSDLVTLRFGGKNRQQIADKVQGILAQRNLAEEQKATPQLYQTQTGSKLNYGGLSGEAGE